MGLGEYHRKRDFGITPEPKGEESKGEGRSFVIQKHAASRLHYDFRLEMEGVLKSWAVPKGPSLDPADKRLAMQTEDHPIDYGDFEGIIPEGQYGGGTVLLWDQGTWEPTEDPHKGLRSGSLKFRLDGRKLQGRWTLVKIKGRDARDDAKSWLLIKERDDEVRSSKEYSVTEERPESVTTGRTLDQIAGDRDRVWNSNRGLAAEKRAEAATAGTRGARTRAPARAARPSPTARDLAVAAAAIPGARKVGLPSRFTAQLATLVDEAPAGDNWLHEVKFDGYRILARMEKGRARLLSRNGKDWTAHFPTVAAAVEALPVADALFDGEVAVVLPGGTTSFQALQNTLGGDAPGPLAYFLFDLPSLGGVSLVGAALEARKALLREVLGAPAPDSPLRYSDHVAGSGREFHARACALGVEGIVSKRGDAHYEAGRSRSWLKIKCLRRQEFVIGGYTDPEGSRVGLGALLIGVHDGAGALDFAGKVGTGFTAKLLEDLRRRLIKIEQPQSPFARARIPGIKRAHWVRPELVAEVAFTEWTSDGRLRHPSFQGLREDKSPRDVVRERPQKVEALAPPEAAAPEEVKPRAKRATKAASREEYVGGVKLTHPDRVLYPPQGITKRDLALLYESIQDWILPHIAGRPLTLVRCPEGTAKDCFYMKHSGVWAPPALRRVTIQEKTKKGEYLVADDVAGLLSLVQMGILEIHTWNALADDLERPDRVVFDLDPDPSVGWPRVVETAQALQRRLRALGLESFVKTTGGKGLHVVAPLRPASTWEESFAFSRAVSEEMERAQPGAYTTEMSKARRRGRILIDYLRNNRGSTSVAAYSTRARPGAAISTPITWTELAKGVRPDQYDVGNIRPRLESLRQDPWKQYWTVRQRITAAVRRELSL